MSDENVQAARQMAAAVTAVRALSGVELKRLADSGGFAVDETTGDRMIRALEEMIDTLDARWAALQKLGTVPPLSTTATARWVARHTANTATDDRGLLTQLQRARAELPQYVEAIRAAKRRYADAETGARTSIERVARS
ncbi:hypothetical protein B0I33_101460 [Prauserella shujinwangii]|uniref:Uncharacterized protein n=1 Tax=Prauserella shujinwangii TaxID=1453103 RepID=A0A2T0M3J7_9PSEU|nr:hypothetical protein [Prauserella shujinwangii]PRX51307.1 hypothetical protein B0I33_101460 [Prauserella shujinwangii]